MDPSLKSLKEQIDRSLNSLGESIRLIKEIEAERGKEAIELITSGIGSVLYASTFIPGLNDNDETPKSIGTLTAEQTQIVSKLSPSQIEIIDNLLLAEADVQWRKVARLVGSAMMADFEWQKGIPDIFYAQRIRRLVEYGRLESQGNLDFMRFSEVRLPESK